MNQQQGLTKVRTRERKPPNQRPSQNNANVRYLNDRLVYWKRELQLNDWTVSVAMIRRDDLHPMSGVNYFSRSATIILPYREF